MIKSVISDLGKVIIFFENQIFFEKMSRFCPFSPEEIEEEALKHFELIIYFDTGKITPEEFYKRIITILKADLDYSKFYEIYNDVFSLNPPVLKIMKQLKSKHRLVLLSNTDVMRFGFVKRKFPEILIFDAYVLSYEVGLMKPHPNIYIEALKKAHSRPEEAVFIDDREENVQAAFELGIQAVHFKSKTDLALELKKLGLSF